MTEGTASCPVLYLSGSGRSGSTMLERILHSAPGVVAVGELHCLWRLTEHEIRCACTVPFPADPFWRDVLAHARIGLRDLAELRRLEALVCRTGYLARRRFSPERLRAEPEVQQFLALNRRLFDAIAAVSGATLLVDSSKAGPRAWLLALDHAVHIAHLHRDPADVRVSWRSVKFDPGLGTPMKRMPILAAAADWWKVDRLARRLARHRSIAWIDYRSLCDSPREILASLFALLRLRLPAEPAWIAPDAVMPGPDYHSLNGNPDRFDPGPLRIARRPCDWSRVAPLERPLIRAAARLLLWGRAA